MQRLFILIYLSLLCVTYPPRCKAQQTPALHFKPLQFGTALLSDYSTPPAGGTQDSIFIVTVLPNTLPAATLTASVENATAAKLEIQEIEINESSYTFSWKTIAKDDANTSLSIPITKSSAYRLLRTEAGKTQEKRIWILFDNVQLTEIYIEDLCAARTLSPRYNHDRSTITDELFTYTDLTSKYLLPINTIGRNYFKNFEWFDDRHSPLTDFSTSTLKIDSPAPLEPQGYRLVITNFYNRQLIASSDILDPISVKSAPNVMYIDKPDDNAAPWQNAGKSLTHEAPLYLKLGDNSKNADSVIWTIRNDPRAVRSGNPDTLFIAKSLAREKNTYEIKHSLFTAGSYIATLRTVNTSKGCIDTANITINVDSSLINTRDIPNVFTPNGDFINDIFLFKNPETSVRSIRDFKIEIFNRGGQCIYAYQGNPRKWEGWNGKRKNTGGDEPQGVYFFVIQAEGWDGKNFGGKTYRSFVHLYR